MANKQIIEYNASTITNDNDALLFQSSGGVTSKIVWSDIVNKIVSSYFQPGDNITITRSGNVLTFSATDSGETYSAGAGIDITNNAISFKLGDGLTLNEITGNIDVARGTAATVEVGNTTTGEPGTNASVTNSGTSSAAVLNFVIPRGADGTPGTPGEAATVSVGTVTTGAAGSDASVTNSGTSTAAVFDFVIPRGNVGETGAAGQDGTTYTPDIGTVTTLQPGQPATASVSVDSSTKRATFNFGIPKGEKGDGSDLDPIYDALDEKEPLIFFGTMAEWSALTDEEKAKYRTVKIKENNIFNYQHGTVSNTTEIPANGYMRLNVILDPPMVDDEYVIIGDIATNRNVSHWVDAVGTTKNYFYFKLKNNEDVAINSNAVDIVWQAFRIPH